MPNDRNILLRNIAILLILILIPFVTQSRCEAADLETSADVRCMLVGLRMMTLSTAQQQTDGAMLAIYYFGRLEGHAPHADVEKLLRDQAKQTTLAQLRKDAVRCGQTLAQKGRDLQRIGAEFSRDRGHGSPGK